MTGCCHTLLLNPGASAGGPFRLVPSHCNCTGEAGDVADSFIGGGGYSPSAVLDSQRGREQGCSDNKLCPGRKNYFIYVLKSCAMA